MRRHQTKSWVMASGERYCLLEDRETGLPAFHPLLYVTTQIRNKSQSYSAMEQAFGAINVLFDFLEEARITNLECRFLKREFLTPHECQGLRDHCQKDYGRGHSRGVKNVISIQTAKTGYKPPVKFVANSTQYGRLSQVASYLEWLARHLLSKSIDGATSKAIEVMKTSLLTLRPYHRGRNDGLDTMKGLSREQEELLTFTVRPGADKNPFVGEGIQVRNQLIVRTLRFLGIRRGELLNIRVDDIDFRNSDIVIRRRADEKGDPRVRQPLVKTKGRRLPLDPQLAQALRHYVVHVRRYIPNSAKFPYLFITHKSGPTQGQPMSIEGYKQVIRQISATSPLLADFSGHDLRHTWNDRFSEHMDGKENPEPESQQEKIRESFMGWSENSGTAKTYNKRFIQRKARAVGLELQQAAHDAAVGVKAK
jgi:integrase